MTRIAQLASMGLLLAGLTACQDRTGITAYTDRRIANEAMVNSVFEEQARAAIVADRTLHPYHFELTGHELNELGQKHLDVLAQSIRRGPITISVARGDVSPELYEQRVQRVMAEFAAQGVDTREVVITEDLPAGAGTTATRAVAALQPSTPAAQPASEYIFVPPAGGPPVGGNR